jgi:ABC-type amino acid transport substrate-binding protein
MSRPLVLLLALAASAAAAQAPGGGPLTVAVYPAPPFAEQGPDSTWTGLGPELAGEVGQLLGRPARFVAVRDAEAAVAAVAAGRADAALAPVTARSEAEADFAVPFYAARLGIAEPQVGRLAEIAGRFFSPLFFQITAGLAVLLLVVGIAIWAIERHENSDDFDEGARSGIWDGFWWAGVTMTTIGYGDKSPKTVPGQTLALFWMLVSMAVTAVLTAALVSALGLGSNSGGGGAQIPEDLRGERVGVVAGSTAEAVVREANVDARPFPTARDGLRAIDEDSLDVFVGTAPHLRATLDGAPGLSFSVQTTGAEIERWAFAVAPGSPLRETLTRAVLERVHSPDWPSTVNRHVGGSN